MSFDAVFMRIHSGFGKKSLEQSGRKINNYAGTPSSVGIGKIRNEIETNDDSMLSVT